MIREQDYILPAVASLVIMKFLLLAPSVLRVTAIQV